MIIGDYTKKPNNVCSIDQFIELIKIYNERGNKHAQKIATSLIGASIHQLFFQAFDKEFSKEAFQEKLIEWQKNRTESKDLYWILKPAIEIWYAANADKTTATLEQHKMSCFQGISRGLFAKSPKEIASELGANRDNISFSIRDHMGVESLRRINHIQTLAAIKISDENLKPYESVQYALATFNFPVISYKE